MAYPWLSYYCDKWSYYCNKYELDMDQFDKNKSSSQGSDLSTIKVWIEFRTIFYFPFRNSLLLKIGKKQILWFNHLFSLYLDSQIIAPKDLLL